MSDKKTKTAVALRVAEYEYLEVRGWNKVLPWGYKILDFWFPPKAVLDWAREHDIEDGLPSNNKFSTKQALQWQKDMEGYES